MTKRTVLAVTNALPRRARSRIVGLLALLLAGCSPSTGTVSGSVTYDDRPLDRGEIVFHPTDGKGGSIAIVIVDGHFRAPGLLPGPKTVEVKSSRLPREDEAGGSTVAGNNVPFEVVAGNQMLTITLTRVAK